METLKQHDDIRQQLLDYHQKYYSANLMKLAIYGIGRKEQRVEK